MIRVNELFSGIGAFRKALINLNIPHQIVGISEIDKYAIKSYEAMYGKTRNYGDISKVQKLDYADLWTYGFPCQDISVAGFQQGIIPGKTRSGLLYEVQRLLWVAKENGELPKYLILENVKNLVGKNFKTQFLEWLQWLDELGYNSYWDVINARNCGIPQQRERVFAVSIRKDVDNGTFKMPEPIPLKKKLSDCLESGFVDREVSLCIARRYAGFNGSQSYLRRRYFGKSFGQAVFEGDTTVNEQREFFKSDPYKEFPCGGRIRQMTTLECFRLFGFSDSDHEKAASVSPPTQLYYQAGNSIVVDVLILILQNIFLSKNSPMVLSAWLDSILLGR